MNNVWYNESCCFQRILLYSFFCTFSTLSLSLSFLNCHTKKFSRDGVFFFWKYLFFLIQYVITIFLVLLCVCLAFLSIYFICVASAWCCSHVDRMIWLCLYVWVCLCVNAIWIMIIIIFFFRIFSLNNCYVILRFFFCHLLNCIALKTWIFQNKI